MLSIIKSLLLKFVDDIDAGNCNLDLQQQHKILNSLTTIANPENELMTKNQAAEYIGVCRATFDNYVKDGFIPKGFTIGDSHSLFWNRYDLNDYLASINKEQ